MSRMFISKKQLLGEIEGLTTNNKQVLPILTIIGMIGVVISLFLLLPILVLWLILLSLYLPFYYLDLFIAKQINKRKKNV
jgi:Flp pilus assembly protein TadB